jgi:hypothetical protein
MIVDKAAIWGVSGRVMKLTNSPFDKMEEGPDYRIQCGFRVAREAKTRLHFRLKRQAVAL